MFAQNDDIERELHHTGSCFIRYKLSNCTGREHAVFGSVAIIV